MNTEIYSTETEATADATYRPAAYANLFTLGLKRVVELSKSSLDLMVTENAEAMAAQRKAINMPVFLHLELAGNAFKGYVTLQKNLLDMAVGQSTAILHASRDNNHIANKAKTGMKAQQSILDSVAMQPEADATIKQQCGITNTPVQSDTDVESVRLRMLAKKIVDFAMPLVTKPEPSVN